MRQSLLQPSAKRIFLLLCLLLMLPGIAIHASPLTVQSMTLGLGSHDSIVKEQARSVYAILQLESPSSGLVIGYRNRNPVQDISLRATREISNTFALVSNLHTSLGTADAVLIDLVVGYEHGFTHKGFFFSYGLGLQASVSFLPVLELPLFNASPYLAAKLCYSCQDRFKLVLSSTTNTLFDYACQSISPILGSDLAVAISDELEAGASFFMQLSDVSPEAVLIVSKEVLVYATYKPRN